MCFTRAEEPRGITNEITSSICNMLEISSRLSTSPMTSLNCYLEERKAYSGTGVEKSRVAREMA